MSDTPDIDHAAKMQNAAAILIRHGFGIVGVQCHDAATKGTYVATEVVLPDGDRKWFVTRAKEGE